MHEIILTESQKSQIIAGLRENKCVKMPLIGFILISPPGTWHFCPHETMHVEVGLGPEPTDTPILVGQTCTLKEDLVIDDKIMALAGEDVYIEAITHKGYVVHAREWTYCIGNIPRSMLRGPDEEDLSRLGPQMVKEDIGREPRPVDEHGQPKLYEHERYYNNAYYDG